MKHQGPAFSHQGSQGQGHTVHNVKEHTNQIQKKPSLVYVKSICWNLDMQTDKRTEG